jgi:hypothetical protein
VHQQPHEPQWVDPPIIYLIANEYDVRCIEVTCDRNPTCLYVVDPPIILLIVSEYG